MRVQIGGIVAALVFCSMAAIGQQGLVGSYYGEYPEPTGHGWPKTQGATLQITSAKDGKLSGKLVLGMNECRGDYQVEGTYQDSKLDMRTSEGSLRGCGQQQISLEVQGDKLVGKYGGAIVQFSRK